MTKIALTLTAAIAAALATPAVAQGDLMVRGSRAVDDTLIRVSYGDLQLAQASDADTLRTRVKQAVRRGCGTLYGSTQVSQEWTCRDIAAQAAAPQVDQAIAAAEAGRALAAGSVVVRLARR